MWLRAWVGVRLCREPLLGMRLAVRVECGEIASRLRASRARGAHVGDGRCLLVRMRGLGLHRLDLVHQMNNVCLKLGVSRPPNSRFLTPPPLQSLTLSPSRVCLGPRLVFPQTSSLEGTLERSDLRRQGRIGWRCRVERREYEHRIKRCWWG